MRNTKSQLRATQIAKLQAEQDAYDRNVKESVKTAAFARCAAVEELYEMLGVKHERPMTREGKNGPVQVATDRDETKRSARLVEAVSALLEDKEVQKLPTVVHRDERGANAAQPGQPTPEHRSAPAEPSYSSSYAQTS